jgi:excinuclease UvrABC nuclease subunit
MAGELDALLQMEERLVKDTQPIFNRQLRHERSLCACRLTDDLTVISNSY